MQLRNGNKVGCSCQRPKAQPLVTEDTEWPVLRRVTTGKLRSIKSNPSPGRMRLDQAARQLWPANRGLSLMDPNPRQLPHPFDLAVSHRIPAQASLYIRSVQIGSGAFCLTPKNY